MNTCINRNTNNLQNLSLNTLSVMYCLFKSKNFISTILITDTEYINMNTLFQYKYEKYILDK
jgi:hypothetical protein